MSLLEIESVGFTYGGSGSREVLGDVNLSIDRNEVVSVVGESGCGKSTLGKLVAGLLQPTVGRIYFDGVDTSELRGRARREWRRRVQLIHQDPYGSLNPGLSIGSTLRTGLIGRVERRHLRARMLELLGEVGLDATPEFLRRYPHQLSGGQRQRVSIARAISMGPRLVVADEVTSMLDVSMRVAILDLLLSFRRSDVTYLFISHDFGVVRYFTRGGRIVVMFYGIIVEEGPTNSIITGPKHPYTYELLSAIPVPNPDVADARRASEVGGEQHSLARPNRAGCVFAARCPYAEDICRSQRPPYRSVDDGHRVACFFPERVPTLENLAGRSGSFATDGSSGADQDGAGSAGHVGACPTGTAG